MIEDTTQPAAARHWLDVGQPERALSALEGEIGAEATYLRTLALCRLQRWSAAVHSAELGLADEAESQALLYLLSFAREQLGELPAAEMAILAALEIDPDDVAFLCRYAEIVLAAAQFDKAEALIARAAAIEPEGLPVLEARAVMHLVAGRLKEARAATLELLSRDPQSLRGRSLLAALDYETGHAEQAAARYGDIVADAPDQHELALQGRLARIYSSPLAAPMRALSGVHPAVQWIVAIVLIKGLEAAGQKGLALVAAGLWVSFCISTWVICARMARIKKKYGYT